MRARDGQKRNAEHFQSQMEGRLGLDARSREDVGKKFWPEAEEKRSLTMFPYFCNYRNMKKPDPLRVTRSADRFAALGAEPRLAILRLLLSAHPTGMIAGEVQEELEIPASTLSHHLEKLKQVGLLDVRRVGTFLWYSANTDALR